MKAILFDLDGVIVATEPYHFQAWRTALRREGIPFDQDIYENLRGLSRKDTLEKILLLKGRKRGEKEKQEILEEKNRLYVSSLSSLSEKDILPGFRSFLSLAKEKKRKCAVASSSKNARAVLKKLGLLSDFDAITDGNEIAKAKPDPEVFLLAAEKLGVSDKDCRVIEDGKAGIEAAKKAGRRAVGIKEGAKSPLADYRFSSFDERRTLLK